MLNLKKPIIFFSFLLILWFGWGFYFSRINIGNENKIVPIVINNQIIKAEVVSTPAKLEKGLGGRNDLCDSCGMLFEFSQAGKYSFWMKDMKFPLDIIWISDGKIVHLEKNVSQTFSGTISPPEDADSVLEINAGKSDELGIKIGDSAGF